MEFGVFSFGDLIPDARTGQALSPGQRLDHLIAAAKLTDELGLEVFGVGEHHRADMAVSSPAVVLAAAAQATRRVRLTSATTVLSTLDPVRVFQDFATLDLLSHGRAEIIAGRGSFTESFPLFGYSLNDYDALFAEKLELLLELGAHERTTWKGSHRPALRDAEVSPRPSQPRIPVWIGVGGTPQSAVRAGLLGLPLAMALIGGDPARFTPFAELYRQAAAEAGHAPETLRLGINSPGYIARDSQQAIEVFRRRWGRAMTTFRRIPGGYEMPRADAEREASLKGALFIGSPQQIVEKILYQHELFAHDRFLIQLDIGATDFQETATAIELFGTEIAPAVRKALATKG
jgi:probable LLM family oxidoreductase